jgi:hypothetical protein
LHTARVWPNQLAARVLAQIPALISGDGFAASRAGVAGGAQVTASWARSRRCRCLAALMVLIARRLPPWSCSGEAGVHSQSKVAGSMPARPIEHSGGAATPQGCVHANVRDVRFGRGGAGSANQHLFDGCQSARARTSDPQVVEMVQPFRAPSLRFDQIRIVKPRAISRPKA